MFDVGNLPVLTLGDCVLKAEVACEFTLFYVFNVFFKYKKKHFFCFFKLLHTFSRTLHAYC